MFRQAQGSHYIDTTVFTDPSTEVRCVGSHGWQQEGLQRLWELAAREAWEGRVGGAHGTSSAGQQRLPPVAEHAAGPEAADCG